MSDDRKETFSLDGGKYEIDRNQAGLMIGARRHGEPWPAGFEQLRNMGVVHAMLDRIEADREAMQQALEALEGCSNLTQTAIDHKLLHTAIATLRTAIAEAKKVADAPVLSRYVMHDNHTFTKLPADNDVAYALAMKCFDDDGGWVDLCGAWSDERTSPRRRRPVSLQAHGLETRAEFAAATLKWLQENPGGQDE